MNAAAKLGAYGVVLVAVLGAGAAVGAVAGPIDVGGDDDHEEPHEQATAKGHEASSLPAAGLLVSEDGYHFRPEDRLADAGEFAFTIVGPDGHPVREYDVLHDRELHLIVASRDLRHFAHLHPTRDAEGRWSVELPELAAGPYRAFADFRPTGGTQHTLGVDLLVPGTVQPGDALRPQLTDTVDGYEVSLERDADSAEVTVIVRRGGEVVTTEPYLGAAGHLVGLRDGDLAYLHVHPLDEVPSGPVRFAVEVPSAGTYGLFFDFQIDGVVRTARFVVDVTTAPSGAAHGDADDH